MSKQTGIILTGPNEPFIISDDVPRHSPGPKQALVKCLAVGINPVEPLQQHSGLLVNEWPAILGSDYAAVVIEVGSQCTKFKPGDYIYGCAPLGQNKLSPFQETFLVEEDVFFVKSPNLSTEETCTISVGLLTSGLCLISGLELELPEAAVKATERDEWIVVLGGTGSVGQFGVQIGRLCGYKVLASCSPSKESLARQNGATETFNNRDSVDEQLSRIREITEGKFARIFDSTAYGYEIMVKALETCSNASEKYLASVDDWSEFKTPPSINEYRAELGHLCRLDETLGIEVTNDVIKMMPKFEAHLKAGTLKPIPHIVYGTGWEKVIQGIQDLENGKVSKKIVVRVQEE